MNGQINYGIIILTTAIKIKLCKVIWINLKNIMLNLQSKLPSYEFSKPAKQSHRTVCGYV